MPRRLSRRPSGSQVRILLRAFFLFIGLYSSEVEHHTCNVGVSGSIPDEGIIGPCSSVALPGGIFWDFGLGV